MQAQGLLLELVCRLTSSRECVHLPLEMPMPRMHLVLPAITALLLGLRVMPLLQAIFQLRMWRPLQVALRCRPTQQLRLLVA